jgi:NAD(P)-dependent dehydrogenase (short-subunit alcohol dehydrogenase family)
MMSVKDLEGRAALVTGSSRGLGAAIARKLAASGVSVAVHGLTSFESGQKVVQAIREAGGKSALFLADIADEMAVKRLVDQVLETWRRLDVLVCAAGLNCDVPVLKLDTPTWSHILRVNLEGTYLTCRIAAPALTASGDGTIVTLASATAFSGRENGAPYCAAVAGVVALTKCLARELAPAVRANVVVPGLIATAEAVSQLGLLDPGERGVHIAGVPLQRLGHPEEVAEVVAFLAGSRASFVTGQVWWVNGGAHMGPGLSLGTRIVTTGSTHRLRGRRPRQGGEHAHR